MAVNQKITELTADTDPTTDDLFVMVNDPGGTPSTKKTTGTNATKALATMVGDAGSGGTKGLVPAPAAGDTAAGKFLKADGTFAVPTGGTPGAHASSHQNGGGDEISVAGLLGVLADPQVPITENVQDIVGAMVVAGTNVTVTYNDGAGTLTIDASGGGGSIAPLVIEDANTVAQRNGTTAQKLRVHKTFTSSTNFEALALYSDGADLFVESEKGSTGSFRVLKVGGSQLQLRTPIAGASLQNNWDINSNSDGAILPGTTKVYDIGSPSKYVRNVFSLNTPKRLAADFTKTGDTTLADVTGLSREIQSNKRYAFEAELWFDADVTGGHKYAIAASGGAPTNIIYQIESVDNGTPFNNLISARQTSSGGASGQAGATAGFTRITGFIRAGADGNLTVQFAQNAASGASSLLAGSWFKVECIEN